MGKENSSSQLSLQRTCQFPSRYIQVILLSSPFHIKSQWVNDQEKPISPIPGAAFPIFAPDHRIFEKSRAPTSIGWSAWLGNWAHWGSVENEGCFHSLILLMAEIRRSPVEVGSLSQYLQGFYISGDADFLISQWISVYIYIFISTCFPTCLGIPKKKLNPSQSNMPMGGWHAVRPWGDVDIYPPKFNSSPLKNGGWKTILSYWGFSVQ